MQYTAEPSRALTLLFAASIAFAGSMAFAGCGGAAEDGDDEAVVLSDADAGSRTRADAGSQTRTDSQTGDQTDSGINSDAGGTPPQTDIGHSDTPDDTGGPFTDAGTTPRPDTGSQTGGSTDTGSRTGGSADTGSGNGGSTQTCSGTRRMCNGECTEMLSNPDNCGSCGKTCAEGASCVNGLCDCQNGLNMCNGQCVDLTSNADHCFQCGNACGAGMMCQNSVCVESAPEASVLKYTNQARQTPTDCGKWGLYPAGPPLTRNSELDKAALAHAKSMAKHDFFAHTDPTDGSDFVVRTNRTNYKGTATHENIARGLRQSARRVVDGWIASDNHCRGLANPNYQEIGIAYVKLSQPNGTWDSYWVQVFGVK